MKIWLARSWRAVTPIALLIPVFLFQTVDVFGTCVKEVKYRLMETRSHAIESGVDIEDLSTADLLRGKTDLTYFDVNICIGTDGFLTRTTTRIQGENSFYPNPIYTIIYAPSGTSFYKKDGTLIATKAHIPDAVQNLPGVSLAMTQAQIDDYGLNVDFQGFEDDFTAHFTALGGTQWSVGTKAYFSSSEFDAIVAPDDLYYLTSNFDHAGNLASMSAKIFQQRGGYVFPQFNIRHDYEDLSVGQLQTTTQKTYLSYEVIDNGQTLVQFFAEDQNHEAATIKQTNAPSTTQFSTFKLPQRATPELSLYPNPTADILNIKFHPSTQDQFGSWVVYDVRGRIVNSGEKPIGDLRASISVNDLADGHYTFKFYGADQFFSHKFIIAK